MLCELIVYQKWLFYFILFIVLCFYFLIALAQKSNFPDDLKHAAGVTKPKTLLVRDLEWKNIMEYEVNLSCH